MPNYFVGKNYYDTTTSGTLISTCSTTAFSNEPSGLTINTSNNHIFFSDDDGSNDKVTEVALGPDSTYCTADDIATVTNVGGLFGATDAEDVAHGNNTLFISDVSMLRYIKYPWTRMECLGGGDDGAVTHLIPRRSALMILKGLITIRMQVPSFIVSTQGTENYLGRGDHLGTLIDAYDLSFMGNTGNLRSDVAYAPGSQTPSIKNLLYSLVVALITIMIRTRTMEKYGR
jgi:hypothetical protein